MLISTRSITSERGPENLVCNAFLLYRYFHKCLPVLVLTGIALIFFSVASMWLSWICVERDVFLIAEKCLHRVKAFSLPTLAHKLRRLGCTRAWYNFSINFFALFGHLNSAQLTSWTHHIRTVNYHFQLLLN